MGLEGDQNDNNEKVEVSRPMDLSDALSLDDATDDFSGRVDALAGNEMAEAPSYEEHLDESVRTKGGSAVEQSNDKVLEASEKRDELREVEDGLRRIEDLINDLNQKSLEHRTASWWENLPIVENFRSHNLATWEGEAIEELKAEIASLRARTEDYGLSTADLDQLLEKLDAIKKPEGVKKWLATLMPGFRTVHRGFRSHKFLRLKSSTGKLRREMQKAQDEPSQLAA
ncbi:MAG: hypothetical protein QF741_04720 [Candidatus Peribacteraceae bacterium]|jgi:hypothetical protein|nr:hypothetical protein [Candidatus Peribacteraceae bacterium]MDP7454385.1 hypothetical protein [Candidatus Peribacteraceae bacterium]MDP7646127.1 hypothetical protein [Candidatus Peribacteraceae bacterium]|tara:strand:- start:1989 stop:2672 length:684 start_codon:yes stop_codon:yes gene_type:complete